MIFFTFLVTDLSTMINFWNIEDEIKRSYFMCDSIWGKDQIHFFVACTSYSFPNPPLHRDHLGHILKMEIPEYYPGPLKQHISWSLYF